MNTPYHWENPVRTGIEKDAASLDARTHVPAPAAVERLKQFMAAQGQAAGTGRRARLAMVHRRLKERNRRRAAARVWVDDVER
jgi:hypothetical protein